MSFDYRDFIRFDIKNKDEEDDKFLSFTKMRLRTVKNKWASRVNLTFSNRKIRFAIFHAFFLKLYIKLLNVTIIAI